MTDKHVSNTNPIVFFDITIGTTVNIKIEYNNIIDFFKYYDIRK